MKSRFTSKVRASLDRTLQKKIWLAGIMCVLAITSRAQILNGSFENGFTSWDTTPGDFIIGEGPGYPIGTDGYYSADLGGGGITGAVLSQTINNFANGGVYQLGYDSACNTSGSPDLSLVTTWEVDIFADGQQIASQTLSQQNVGQLYGSFGFLHRQMTFSVASSVQNITISFKDVTPNGGVGIDTALDMVQVISVPEPGSAVIAGLAVAVGVAMRIWRRQIPGA